MIQLLRLGGVAAATAGLGVWLSGRGRHPEARAVDTVRPSFQVPADAALPEMVVVQGDDPAGMARRAIQELGGIRRFISRGDVVVIKPNIAWDRTAEQAANTNPLVVAELSRLCLDAGARKVVVTDVTINEPRRTFARSGIAEAARAAGADVVLPGESLFRTVDLRGEVLDSWPVLE